MSVGFDNHISSMFWFLTSFSENRRSCCVGIPHEETETRDVIGKIFHPYFGLRSCKTDSSDKTAMHCGFDVTEYVFDAHAHA